MITEIFEAVVKMSITGTAVGAVVLGVKYILQRAGLPRRIMFLLWAVIALRLLCPIMPNTELSVFNVTKLFEGGIGEEAVEERYMPDISPYEERVNDIKTPSEKKTGAGEYAPYIWLAGVIGLLSVSVLDFIRLKRKLRFATRACEGVYIAEKISSAFVFGIIKPKIYIPEGMDEKDCEFVISHEKMHIRRWDYITKSLAYLVLSVHWFNPFVWIMFRMFSDDMELVCDECTVLALGESNRVRYIETLLSFAKRENRRFSFYNVTFSVNPVKKRCVNILKVKKSKAAINVLSVFVCTVVLVLFGTNGTEAVAIKELEAVEKNIERETEGVVELSTEEIVQEKSEELQTISKKPAVKAKESVEKSYSYKEKLVSVIDNVHCDENGNISMSFDLNTEIFLWVRLYEEGSDELIEGKGILTDGGVIQVFTDCDKNKSYKIKLESPLGDTWKVEGSYTIY